MTSPAILTPIRKYSTAILLTCIMVVAVWLRLENITNGLGRDEIATHRISSQGLDASLFHSFYPLTYVLIHFMLKLGDSEVLVRMPSLIAGLLGVWSIYYLGRAWHSRQTGLIASFLLSISSLHIFYSNDARYYSILILAAILTLWMIYRALENPHHFRYWIGYAGAISIGSLTHPFFIPFLWSVGIGSLIAGTKKCRAKSDPLRFVIGLGIATIVGLTPFALAYYRFKLARPNFILNATSPAFQERYTLTPLEYLDNYKTVLLYQQPGKGGLMLALVILGAVFLWRRHRRWSLPVLLVPILFPLPFFFISVNHHFTLRYFTIHAPVALLLVATCLVQLTRYTVYFFGLFIRQKYLLPRQAGYPIMKVSQLVILLIVLGILTTTYLGKYLYDYHYREYWKEQAQAMAPYVTPDDILLYYAPYHPLAGKGRNLLPAPENEIGFYLQRMLINGRRDRFPSRQYYAPDTTEIDTILRTYPNQTVWLIQRISPPIQHLSSAQNRLFKSLLIGQKEIFQVAAAPTTNLVSKGNIEKINISDIDSSGRVNIVPVSNNSKSGTCLHLTPADDGSSASVRFSISTDTATTRSTTDTILQAEQPYMLSFDLKYSQSEGGPQTTGSVRVDIVGKTADGRPVKAHIESFYWYSTFQFQAFPVRPSDYPRLYNATELQLQFSYTGNAGAMWIDNVQFEPGTHPTPYTDGTRLPHDQALANLEAEQ